MGNVCFVCNNDIAWDILENPQKDVSQTCSRYSSAAAA